MHEDRILIAPTGVLWMRTLRVHRRVEVLIEAAVILRFAGRKQ